MRVSAFVVMLLLSPACGPVEDDAGAIPEAPDIQAADIDLGLGDTGSDADNGFPAATHVFDPDGAHTFEIKAPAATWKHLLADAADYKRKRVYKKADVVIDGVLYKDVGLRTFGESSQRNWPHKPNIRIKFNFFDPKAAGPAKLNNIRLKAGSTDDSRLREPLVYDLMRAVGAYAPRYSWGRVGVNGDYYGLYQVLEHLDKRMWRNRFGNKDGPNFDADSNCWGLRCPPEGCDKLPKKYEIEPVGADTSKLVGAAKAIKDVSDDKLEAELGKYMDLDQLVRVYAVEAYVGETDGIHGAGANFEMYQDEKSGLIHVFRHGADSTFTNAEPLHDPALKPPVTCLKHKHADPFWARAWKIPGLKARIDKAFRKLQCEAATSKAINTWFDQYADRIAHELLNDPHGQKEPWPDVKGGVVQLKTWILERNVLVQKLLGKCP